MSFTCLSHPYPFNLFEAICLLIHKLLDSKKIKLLFYFLFPSRGFLRVERGVEKIKKKYLKCSVK